MSKYLEFIEDTPPGRKTQIYQVQNKVNKVPLGLIAWYGGFRKYVFRPFENIIFDAGCLTDISRFLEKLMSERKQLNTNGNI